MSIFWVRLASYPGSFSYRREPGTFRGHFRSVMIHSATPQFFIIIMWFLWGHLRKFSEKDRESSTKDVFRESYVHIILFRNLIGGALSELLEVHGLNLPMLPGSFPHVEEARVRSLWLTLLSTWKELCVPLWIGHGTCDKGKVKRQARFDSVMFDTVNIVSAFLLPSSLVDFFF